MTKAMIQLNMTGLMFYNVICSKITDAELMHDPKEEFK